MEWFDRTKSFRAHLHKRAIKSEFQNEDPKSKKNIEKFVRFFHIDMNQFDPSDINEYPNFQEFFIRKHAVNSRPIADQNDGVYQSLIANDRLSLFLLRIHESLFTKLLTCVKGSG